MKILSFGEILWDIFPDEKKIGGAPFNFAAHAAKLGAESYMVSAIGSDENGIDALSEIDRLGIKRDYIHIDRKYKTGYCAVTLTDGKPSYDLVRDVAYDHIPDVCPRGKFDALYMGTLALRSPDSRRTFEKLLKYTDAKEVFFDVNFRGDFYTRELVNTLLKETTILKISDEEIGFFGKRDHINVLLDLSKTYPKLKYICLTLGKDGALVYDCRNKAILYSDKPKGKVVSTVGAGDGMVAAAAIALKNGCSTSEILRAGVAAGTATVMSVGNISFTKEKYEEVFANLEVEKI
jgi:fructokinase